MILKEADGQNFICAADTFFDPKFQACTRNPYQETVKLTYKNEKTPDNKYQLKLVSVADTGMVLPGEAFQPEKSLRWSTNDSELAKKTISGTDQSSYTFDLDNITAGRAYTFEYVLTDAKYHEFYVKKSQIVMPVKCHVLVDTITDESFGSVNQIIGSADAVTDLCFEFQAKRFSK